MAPRWPWQAAGRCTARRRAEWGQVPGNGCRRLVRSGLSGAHVQRCTQHGQGERIKMVAVAGASSLPAGVDVRGAAAVDQVAGALAVVVRHGLGRAAVEDGQLTAAGPAGGQALQQRAAFPDRAGARLAGLRADVGADALLVGQVGVPADEPGVSLGSPSLLVTRCDGGLWWETVVAFHGQAAAETVPAGGAPGDRTLNPRVKSPLLCQLS